MILSEMRNYIKQRQQVTLVDIINHFDIDEQTARAMLDVWINKAKIHRKITSASCGSSCTQCESASTEIYIWGKEVAGSKFLKEKCQIK